MSFLIDGPWLYGSGQLIGRRFPAAAQPPLAVATAAGFLGVSVPLYLDQPWTSPIWRACRARSGRDWMVNSGLLRLRADRLTRRGHAVAAMLFTTYPLWLWLGLRHGRRARRR